MPENNKKSEKLFRTLLAVGFIMIGTGVVFLTMYPAKEISGFLPFFFLALFLIFGALVYTALILRKAIFFYIAINLCLYAFLAMLCSTYQKPFMFERYWPFIMMMSGIAIIPAGHIHYNKMRAVYNLPALVLFLMGCIFCLFSFKVIKISFKDALAYSWPVIFIGAGLGLVVYYIYSIHNKNHFLESSEDSAGLIGDDL